MGEPIDEQRRDLAVQRDMRRHQTEPCKHSVSMEHLLPDIGRLAFDLGTGAAVMRVPSFSSFEEASSDSTDQLLASTNGRL